MTELNQEELKEEIKNIIEEDKKDIVTEIKNKRKYTRKAKSNEYTYRIENYSHDMLIAKKYILFLIDAMDLA